MDVQAFAAGLGLQSRYLLKGVKALPQYQSKIRNKSLSSSAVPPCEFIMDHDYEIMELILGMK